MNKITANGQNLVVGSLEEWKEILEKQPSDKPFSIIEHAQSIEESLEASEISEEDMKLIEQLVNQAPEKSIPGQEESESVSLS